MKILKTQALRGPNFWHIDRHRLIVVRLDMEGNIHHPDRFYSGLSRCLPNLPSFPPTQEGVAHAVAEIALELQRQAGMPVEFATVRATADRDVYNCVFEYHYEECGRYAARAAVRMCQDIIETGAYKELAEDLADLKEIRLDAQLGPSTESIIAEAKAKKIPWLELGSRAMIQLGYGIYQKRIQATLSDRSSILAVELACDKEGTKRILKDSGIPVPRGTVIKSIKDLEDGIIDVGGFPVVIKPLDGNHGRGITIDVRTFLEAEDAFELAQEVSDGVIIEKFHRGKDYRVLVIDGHVVAVAERVPAHVTGDGRSSLSQLIEITNKDPRRGDGHDNVLTRIVIDQTSQDVLARQGFSLDSVPAQGQVVYLKATANLSTGGISVDRTDEIHPENIWLCQRVARIIGLDIAGIDIVTPDIKQPIRDTDGVIVEVNAAPGFRMHTAPSVGIPRNVGEPVIDMLFPPGTPCRIPIIAVTGTNGKTTTTRLIAHIFKQLHRVVGYTTTDGIYIGDWVVEKGDTTGPYSAQVILRDPTVEIAVLETARGGILRSGLGFDRSDISIVLNVQADHLGSGDIDTIEDLGELKSVVVKAVRPGGYAILNAEDPIVAGMARNVVAEVAYFSLDPHLSLVKEHVRQGGIAAVYENGYLSILKQGWTIRVEQANLIPLTLGGKAEFMIQNCLAAVLATYLQGVRVEDIKKALTTFVASADQTPGRMNLFNLGRFHVLVDYAHNPAGYRAVSGFIKSWQGEKIGVIGAPGDRRNSDIEELGELAVEMFDRVIIKEDCDLRGRKPEETAGLICRGITHISPNFPYQVILAEEEAIQKALAIAPDRSLVVVFPEKVDKTIELIKAAMS